MKRMRGLWLASVAVFALSGLVVSEAQAQGPYAKVNGKTLKVGESRTVLTSIGETFEIETPTASQRITCTGFRFLGFLRALTEKVDLLGIIHYTGCTTTTNGENCVIPGGTILTNPVVGLFGFANSNETGPILVLFEPHSGKVFVKINFEKPGGECTFPDELLEGTMAANALVARKPLEAGQSIETLKGELSFTKTNKVVWLLKLGNPTIKSIKAALRGVLGAAANLSGIIVNEVDEGGSVVPWGIFAM
jgi:hypothetical protein